VVVRAIEKDDADTWAILRGRLWPDADAEGLAAETRAFAAGVETPAIAAAFLAVEEEGAITLGFIELAIRPFADGCDSQPVPHVEGWYVEPFARGRGAGRALMHAGERWARELGFVELASDTEIENGASLAAHQRCGFLETERLIKLRKTLC